jgi:hypothetical protein
VLEAFGQLSEVVVGEQGSLLNIGGVLGGPGDACRTGVEGPH